MPFYKPTPEVKGYIPRIIHTVWIGPKRKPQRLIESWGRMNPTCQLICWEWSSLKAWKFINQRHIDSMPNLSGKVTIMRYEILYKFGGVMVDADSECVRRLDPFFFENDSFSCFMNEELRGGMVSCGYMGACKHNKLMELCVRELESCPVNLGPPSWANVGPFFFTYVIQKYRYQNIQIYPSHYFIPDFFSGEKYQGDGPVYAKQYWGSTLNIYDEIK